MDRKDWFEPILVSLTVVLLFLSTSIGFAADVTEDTDETTNLDIDVESGLPHFTYRNVTQGGQTILNNNQGNVATDTNMTVNITVPNGIDTIEHLNVTTWFDAGDDTNSAQDVYGVNYRFKAEYDNTSGAPEDAWYIHTDYAGYNFGTQVGPVDSTYRTINFKNNTAYNVTFTAPVGDWSIKGFHHAQPSTGSWGGLDTTNTWNIEWAADMEQDKLDIESYNEYGIYKYVEVNAQGDAYASAPPGSTVSYETNESLNTTIRLATNDRFNLTTQLDNHLTDTTTGETIAVDNIAVKSNYTENGSSTNGHSFAEPWMPYEYTQDYQYFSGLSSPIYLTNASNNQPHPAYHNEPYTVRTWSCWQVDIPMGTSPGSYQAAVNYTISMDSEF